MLPLTTPYEATPLPLLDTRQLNVEIAAGDSVSQAHRFAGCQTERDLWLEALPLVECDEKRVHRFRSCGSDAWVQYSRSRTTFRIVCNTCKLRICPVCALRHKRAAADRIAATMRSTIEERARSWKLLTLTLRHNDDSLADQHDRLRASFRKLRQRKLWRTTAKYGYAVIETTYNRWTHQWHGHLHVLVYCSYIPVTQLCDTWLSITGDSMIVDIRRVDSTHRATRYVTKYLGKPPAIESLDCPVQRLGEYYLAISGRRLLIPFGRPPQDAAANTTDDEIDDWEPVCTLPDLLRTAGLGDPKSIEILRRLKEHDHAEAIADHRNTS